MICVHDFPRVEVSMKVGVMEFGLYIVIECGGVLRLGKEQWRSQAVFLYNVILSVFYVQKLTAFKTVCFLDEILAHSCVKNEKNVPIHTQHSYQIVANTHRKGTKNNMKEKRPVHICVTGKEKNKTVMTNTYNSVFMYFNHCVVNKEQNVLHWVIGRPTVLYSKVRYY